MLSKSSLLAWQTSLLYWVIAMALAASDYFLSQFIPDVSLSQLLHLRIDLALITLTAALLFVILRAQFDRLNKEVEARKQTEAALMKLSRAVEQSPASIFITDVNGVIEYVNPKFTDLTGYTREETLGRNPRILKSGRTPRVVYEHLWKTILSGAEWHGELVNRKKNGEIFWEHASISAVRNAAGEITNFIAVKEDITERKQSDEALRESEERFRDLANNISQLAWMANDSGWIYWYNSRWFEYTGATLDDMQGWGWQKVHHPDLVEQVMTKFKRHIEQGIEWEDTFLLRGADGNYHWFLSRAVPIRNSHGEIIRWFGTNTDVTEQKKAEEALRKSEERYRDAAIRLERMLDEKELLMRELHHRAKNNMQLIASMLRLQAYTLHNEELTRLVAENVNRIQSMSKLHELLYRSADVSRIDSREYISNLIQHLQRSYGSKREIALDLKIEKDIILHLETAISCGLAINELVTNAFKHAFVDGQRGVIRVHLQHAPDDRFRLIVADTGNRLLPGFDFAGTKTLGMKLVQSLVKGLQGTFQVTTGDETRFIIVFSNTEYKPRMKRETDYEKE